MEASIFARRLKLLNFLPSFTANFAPARKKKVAEGRLGARTPTRTANCRRQPHGQPHGRQTLKRTKVPLAWGLTCGYFRGLGLKIKTRLYAGNLVSQGGSGTYGVGWMRRRGRVTDGLPHRSPDAARNATGTGDLTGATFVGH